MIRITLRRLLNIAAVASTALALIACGGGEDLDSPGIGSQQITVAGTATIGGLPVTGARVILAADGGQIISETSTAADGSYSMTAPRDAVRGDVIVTVTGGSFLDASFDGQLSALHSPDRFGAANATALTSLMSEMASARSEPTPSARLQATLALMVERGILSESDWAAATPTSVDAEELLSEVAQRGLAPWLEAAASALSASAELGQSLVRIFPRAHGGIYRANFSVAPSLVALRGFRTSEPIAIDANEPLSSYGFRVASGPAGAVVDAEGVLQYTPPETGGFTTETLEVSVTHKATGLGRMVRTTLETLPVEVALRGSIGPAGGQLMNDWQDVVLTVPPGAVSGNTELQLFRATTSDGAMVYRLRSNADMSLPARLAAAQPTATSGPTVVPLRAATARRARALAAEASEWQVRKTWKGDYLQMNTATGFINNRLRSGQDCLLLAETADRRGLTCWLGQMSSRLESNCGPAGSCTGKVPVMFIHGYMFGGVLGGGAGTWGSFREDLAAADYAVYEFRWRTNANYKDVAAELEQAIKIARMDTGQRVHLIAHSFGGLLARTYLQDQAGYGIMPYDSADVRSLITLGTPHSGISADRIERHGITLPPGRNSLRIWACNQISCHMAGLDDPSIYTFDPISGPNIPLAAAFGVDETPGELPATLASTLGDFPVDTLALMGLETILAGDSNSAVRPLLLSVGDGLISFEGQRFKPDWGLSIPGSRIMEMPSDIRFEEVVIGEYPSGTPGQEVLFGTRGYSHTGCDPESEDCEANINRTDHPSLEKVKEWLASYPVEESASPPQRIAFEMTVRSATTGMAVEGAEAKVFLLGTEHSEAASASDGVINLETWFYARKRLDLYINAAGYQEAVLMNFVKMESSVDGTPTNLGTVFLTPDVLSGAALRGRAVDALTGFALGGVSVSLKTPFVVRGTVTDGDGYYSFGGLVPGTYEITFSLDGYTNQSRIIVAKEGEIVVSDSSMTPRLLAGQTRIRLSWGADPRDLDSHLRRYTGGYEDYFVYYSNKRGADAVLDLDDTSGYGPETVTIDPTSAGSTYRYVVHHYAGSGSIAASGAIVTVNTAERAVEFRPPTEGGDYWHVFDIVGGEIIPCRSGCMTSTWPRPLGASLADRRTTFDAMPAKQRFDLVE